MCGSIVLFFWAILDMYNTGSKLDFDIQSSRQFEGLCSCVLDSFTM